MGVSTFAISFNSVVLNYVRLIIDLSMIFEF